jgi:hypothetical protein
MTKRRRWLLTAGCAALMFAACRFTEYAEFLRVPASTAQHDEGMTALADGRLVQLVCPPDANCRLKIFKDGRGIGSFDLGAQHYVDVDVSPTGALVWVVKDDGSVERFTLTSDNRILTTPRVVWTPPTGFSVHALAVGRGDFLYVGGVLNERGNIGDEVGVIVRMTLFREPTRGYSVGSDLRQQTVRNDSLDPLDRVTHLDVDQNSGDVYAVNSWGLFWPEGATLHAYAEDLAPIGIPARYYGMVYDLQVGGTLIAVASPWNETTNIAVLTRGPDGFLQHAVQVDPVPVSSFAAHAIPNSFCGYIWTIGAHSPDDEGQVNLFGRHMVCY